MNTLEETVKARFEAATGKAVLLHFDGKLWHLTGGLGTHTMSSGSLLAFVTSLEEGAALAKGVRAC